MDFAATSGMVAVLAAVAWKRGRTAAMRWTVDSASSDRDMGICKVCEMGWTIMWIKGSKKFWPNDKRFLHVFATEESSTNPSPSQTWSQDQYKVTGWSVVTTFPRKFSKKHFSVDSEILAIHPSPTAVLVWAQIQTWLLRKKPGFHEVSCFHDAYGPGVRTKPEYKMANILPLCQQHPQSKDPQRSHRKASTLPRLTALRSATQNTKARHNDNVIGIKRVLTITYNHIHSGFTHADLCAVFYICFVQKVFSCFSSSSNLRIHVPLCRIWNCKSLLPRVSLWRYAGRCCQNPANWKSPSP